MKLSLLFVILYILALTLFVNAQEDLFDPITTVPYVKINYTLVMPQGHAIHALRQELDKIAPACGLTFKNMIKNPDMFTKPDSTDKFMAFIPLPENTTVEQFKSKCDEAVKKHRDNLKLYGKVQINAYEAINLPSTCTETCGVEGCPSCPLLSTCNTDAECGPTSVCSPKNAPAGTTWCISASPSINAMMAFALAVVAVVTLF